MAKDAVPIGDFILERRRELRLTQKDLAERVGCDRSYLSQIERGRNVRFPYAFLKALAVGLELPVEELLIRGNEESALPATSKQVSDPELEAYVHRLFSTAVSDETRRLAIDLLRGVLAHEGRVAGKGE